MVQLQGMAAMHEHGNSMADFCEAGKRCTRDSQRRRTAHHLGLSRWKHDCSATSQNPLTVWTSI